MLVWCKLLDVILTDLGVVGYPNTTTLSSHDLVVNVPEAWAALVGGKGRL